jgi:hypothetical protein
LSILGLVIALIMAKNRAKQIASSPGAACASSVFTQPEAVRQEVQRAMDQAAAAGKTASDALP